MGLQLSYSACEKYKTCPLAWYYHYLLRLRPIVVGSALPFGNAMDQALNVLLQQKMDNKPNYVIAAKEEFLRNWSMTEINGKKVDLEVGGMIKFSKSDFDKSLVSDTGDSHRHPSWESLRTKGLMMVSAYADQIIPRIEKVHAIQHKISLKNEAGDEFIGVVDFIATIEGKVRLMDNKTSSIKYTQTSANEAAQLATYFEACKDEFKLDGVGFVVIPKTIRKKKEPLVPIEMIFGDVDEKLIDKTFREYETVLSGIKNGQFNPRFHDKCCDSVWGCPYQKFIQSGGVDMTGLEFIKSRK